MGTHVSDDAGREEIKHIARVTQLGTCNQPVKALPQEPMGDVFCIFFGFQSQTRQVATTHGDTVSAHVFI